MAVLEKDMYFKASVKMYKTQITKWKLEKNNKERDLLHLIRKDREFQRTGVKKTYRIRKRPTSIDDALEHFRRKNKPISNDVLARECTSPTPSVLSIASIEIAVEHPDRIRSEVSRADECYPIVPAPSTDSQVDVVLTPDTSNPQLAWYSTSQEASQSWQTFDNAPHLEISVAEAESFTSAIGSQFVDMTVLSAVEHENIFPSLRLPELEYEFEMLLPAVTAFSWKTATGDLSMGTDATDSSRSRYLTHLLECANKEEEMISRDHAFNSFAPATNVLCDMLMAKDPWLLEVICDLLVCRLADTNERVQKPKSPVVTRFIHHVTEYAATTHVRYPLRYLRTIFKGGLESHKHNSNQVIEDFADVVNACHVGQSQLSMMASHYRKRARVYSGSYDDAERSLLYEITVRDADLRTEPQNTEQILLSQSIDITLLLTCYEGKNDCSMLLHWSERLESIASQISNLKHKAAFSWKASYTMADTNAKLYNIGLAAVQAQMAHTIAIENFGDKSYRVLYTQDLLTKLQQQMATMQLIGWQ